MIKIIVLKTVKDSGAFSDWNMTHFGARAQLTRHTAEETRQVPFEKQQLVKKWQKISTGYLVYLQLSLKLVIFKRIQMQEKGRSLTQRKKNHQTKVQEKSHSCHAYDLHSLDRKSLEQQKPLCPSPSLDIIITFLKYCLLEWCRLKGVGNSPTYYWKPHTSTKQHLSHARPLNYYLECNKLYPHRYHCHCWAQNWGNSLSLAPEVWVREAEVLLLGAGFCPAETLHYLS